MTSENPKPHVFDAASVIKEENRDAGGYSSSSSDLGLGMDGANSPQRAGGRTSADGYGGDYRLFAGEGRSSGHSERARGGSRSRSRDRSPVRRDQHHGYRDRSHDHRKQDGRSHYSDHTDYRHLDHSRDTLRHGDRVRSSERGEEYRSKSPFRNMFENHENKRPRQSSAPRNQDGQRTQNVQGQNSRKTSIARDPRSPIATQSQVGILPPSNVFLPPPAAKISDPNIQSSDAGTSGKESSSLPSEILNMAQSAKPAFAGVSKSVRVIGISEVAKLLPGCVDPGLLLPAYQILKGRIEPAVVPGDGEEESFGTWKFSPATQNTEHSTEMIAAEKQMDRMITSFAQRKHDGLDQSFYQNEMMYLSASVEKKKSRRDELLARLASSDPSKVPDDENGDLHTFLYERYVSETPNLLSAYKQRLKELKKETKMMEDDVKLLENLDHFSPSYRKKLERAKQFLKADPNNKDDTSPHLSRAQLWEGYQQKYEEHTAI